MSIMTVKGPVEKKEIGHCQPHEHLFIKEAKAKEINNALWLDNYEATLKELLTYKKSGGTSIVDAQPIGSGRMTENLVKASEESKINIIASTGFHKLMYYDDNHWIHNVSVDELKDILKNELVNGMYINTEYNYPKNQIEAKAGIIKTAYSENSYEDIKRYKELLKAASLTSLETKTPIMCHTDKGKGALKVVNYLMELGVKPKAIIICHMDRKADNYEYHYRVANKGVYLDYDTIGRFKYHTDEKEIKLIKKLLEHGCEDRILISLDTTRERMKSYGGNIGLDYINNKFIPLLKEKGIRNEIINMMTRDNPARVLNKEYE